MSWHNTLEAIVTDVYNALNPVFVCANKRLGLQLEQFRNRDFTSMTDEVKAVFKHTTLRLTHVPLAYRVSVDGTGQYNKPVLRTFEDVSEIQQSILADLYRVLGVDHVLLDAEQAGVLQQSYLLLLVPDRAGNLRLTPFLPYQVAELTITDPFACAAGDVSAADRVVLSVPMQPPAASGLPASVSGVTTWCARIVLTREQAYIELPDGQKTGIFDAMLTNPLGRVPVVGTRTAKPTNGLSWFPEVAHDVLSCQIGLILTLSDCEAIMRSQTNVKVLLTGMGAAQVAKKVSDTPNGIIVIDQPDVNAVQLALNPPVQNYIRGAETAAYLLSQYRYLRPEAYQASIVTGSARRADAEGFVENMARQEQRTKRLEDELVALIVDVYNAIRPRALKLDKPRLTVEYRYTETPENRLQRAQALAVNMRNGVEDVFKFVAKEEGVTLAEANQIVRQRIETWRELFAAAGATPGLDKLAPANDPPAEPAAA